MWHFWLQPFTLCHGEHWMASSVDKYTVNSLSWTRDVVLLVPELGVQAQLAAGLVSCKINPLQRGQNLWAMDHV